MFDEILSPRRSAPRGVFGIKTSRKATSVNRNPTAFPRRYLLFNSFDCRYLVLSSVGSNIASRSPYYYCFFEI